MDMRRFILVTGLCMSFCILLVMIQSDTVVISYGDYASRLGELRSINYANPAQKTNETIWNQHRPKNNVSVDDFTRKNSPVKQNDTKSEEFKPIKENMHSKQKQSKISEEICRNQSLNKVIQEAPAFLQNAHFNMTSSTPVLLLTYMRSGSTWLGSITNRAPGAWYLWEPLFHLIDEGYITNGFVCMNNDVCRKPKEDFESHHVILKTLFQLFSCDLENTHPKVKTNLIKRSNDECNAIESAAVNMMKDSRLQRNKAVQNAKGKTIRRNSISDRHRSMSKDCLKVRTKICEVARYRIIKTIRVSMDLVKILKEVIPNMKVIHLIRDPRAITYSRLEGGFPLTRETSAHARGLCKEMLDDVTLNKELRKAYPEEIKTIRYESLAERPEEGAKFIFKFLGANYTKKITEWVYKTTHAQKNNGYYGTVRRDSYKATYNWREHMPFDKVAIIQKACADILTEFGYVKFETEMDLRNLNITAPTTSTFDRFE